MNPTEKKNATLKLKLSAESGYVANSSYRVSPEQWGKIVEICEDQAAPPSPFVMVAREDLEAMRHYLMMAMLQGAAKDRNDMIEIVQSCLTQALETQPQAEG